MHPFSGPSRGARLLGLVSAALFVAMFMGLYQTMTYTPANPKPKLTDKLGLGNNVDGDRPGDTASTSSQGQGGELLSQTLVGTGRVLAEHLTLHGSPATYPRLTRLSDGSILLAFTRFDNTAVPQQRFLTVKQSVDNGRTFVPWGEVTRCVGDCGNLFLIEVPSTGTGAGTEASGPKVLAAFRNHDYLDPVGNRKLSYFRITVCQSLDGGRTWTYLSQAAEKTAPMGLWEPFMRIGSKGEVQMTYSQEFQPRDQDTIMKTSVDGGAMWSPPRTVTGEGELLRDGMTGIAATTDRGRPALVMVFETTRRGHTFTVEAVVSYDDGETWGHRQVVFETQQGANAGSPQIESFDNGGLATVFMTDMDTEDGRKWPKRASVKVVFGGPLVDGKIQWKEPNLACPRPSFWPGIFKMDGTKLMVVCEHGEGILGRVLEWDSR